MGIATALCSTLSPHDAIQATCASALTAALDRGLELLRADASLLQVCCLHSHVSPKGAMAWGMHICSGWDAARLHRQAAHQCGDPLNHSCTPATLAGAEQHGASAGHAGQAGRDVAGSCAPALCQGAASSCPKGGSVAWREGCACLYRDMLVPLQDVLPCTLLPLSLSKTALSLCLQAIMFSEDLRADNEETSE